MESLFCLLRCQDGKVIEVPREIPIDGIWGRPTYFEYNEPIDFAMPEIIDVVYISIIEGIAYRLEAKLNYHAITESLVKNSTNEEPFIVIGLGPFGLVALWCYSSEKSSLIEVFSAETTNISSKLLRKNQSATIKTICNHYIESCKFDTSILKKIDKIRAFKAMKQYLLKYNCQFGITGQFDDSNSFPDCKIHSLREICFDGSFNYSNNGDLTEYHVSGIPKKIFLEWETKGILYYACFFSEYDIINIYERLYDAHPEARADFIIRIDAENKKYELALYRQGLKEPMVIPESAYQLIVFKNKFEDYRSDNYNQPRGAWIW